MFSDASRGCDPVLLNLEYEGCKDSRRGSKSGRVDASGTKGLNWGGQGTQLSLWEGLHLIYRSEVTVLCSVPDAH